MEETAAVYELELAVQARNEVCCRLYPSGQSVYQHHRRDSLRYFCLGRSDWYRQNVRSLQSALGAQDRFYLCVDYHRGLDHPVFFGAVSRAADRRPRAAALLEPGYQFRCPDWMGVKAMNSSE